MVDVDYKKKKRKKEKKARIERHGREINKMVMHK